MGEKKYLPIPVSGPLDTAHPATNRRVGTLVRAVDVGHEWIGPRLGPKAWTWAERATTAASSVIGFVPTILFDGSNTYVTGAPPREGVDLGTQWTADIAFHAHEARVSAAAVPIWSWKVDSSIAAIEIGFYGSLHANAGKLYAIVKTTSSPGVVDATYTLVGAAPLFSTALTSGGQIVRCFVRLIRNGQHLTLISTRGSTATSSALNPAYGHNGSTSSATGEWIYGRSTGLGANDTFKGYIIRSLLRTTAVSTSAALQATEHRFPRAGDVVHFAGTKSFNSDNVCDLSRYGARKVRQRRGCNRH